MQFDESLQAHSATCTLTRREPSNQREIDAFRADLNELTKNHITNLKNIVQYYNCDPESFKELNSEGKRAKFGNRKLKGNNHQTRIVCYPKDNDPMKSLLSTTEIKKFKNQDSVQIFFRWETVSGMKMAEKTYTSEKKPLLPTKKDPFVALDLAFQGISTIRDYITWKQNPSYFKDAIFCNHGIVVGFMGKPVRTLEDLRKIYQQKYQLDSLDTLTVSLEIVRNTAPFKREQISLNVDPKKRALIVERRRIKAEMIEKKRLAKLAEERRLEQLRIAKLAEEKSFHRPRCDPEWQQWWSNE